MMNPYPVILVLIPVYNEAENILRLLETLSALGHQLEKSFRIRIVLIDDGSRDQTSVVVEQFTGDLDLVILQHEKNLGPGRAFGTGFRYAAEHCADTDFVLTMEGDNTSRIELIKQMLYRMEEGFDIILASPYLYGGRIENTSVYRIFLSSMANLFIKELLGLHGISTVSSFFRLYRARSLKRLQAHYGIEIIERNGFECMVEMVMKMVFLQMKISEISMVLDTKARVGKSKMKVAKTIRGYLALWLMKEKWRAMSK